MRNSIGLLLVTILAARIAIPLMAATAPNGLIAYSAWDDDLSYDIWLIDPATPATPPVRLTVDGQYNSNPDWSPDGTRIAYDGWADFGAPRIWVMDADPLTDDWAPLSTPDCTDLDGCFWDYHPAWSPDGAKIAFNSNRSPHGWGMGGAEIFLMDATGETPTSPAVQLTDTPSPDESGNNPSNDLDASWAPDSARLVFASSRDEGREYSACDLYVMDAADADGDRQGDNLRRITFDSVDAPDVGVDCALLQPAWSPVPGSSLVVFASTRSGYFDIWVIDVDNPSDLRNVTRSDTDYDDSPGWSPDGTQIVFRSSRSGAYELWTLPVPPPGSTMSSTPNVLATTNATLMAAPVPTRLTHNGGDENGRNDEQGADWGAKSAGGVDRYNLQVIRGGNRTGQVKSTPSGITCGADCVQSYADGTRVTLTAKPALNSIFAGWSGADGCSAGLTCVVTMNSAMTVTATFTRLFELTVTSQGGGIVKSTPRGINCGADCSQSYTSGTVVTLRAPSTSTARFTGWSGACKGAVSTCQVTMKAAKSVTATFVSPP